MPSLFVPYITMLAGLADSAGLNLFSPRIILFFSEHLTFCLNLTF